MVFSKDARKIMITCTLEMHCIIVILIPSLCITERNPIVHLYYSSAIFFTPAAAAATAYRFLSGAAEVCTQMKLFPVHTRYL